MNSSATQIIFEPGSLEAVLFRADNAAMTKIPESAVGRVIAARLKEMGKPRQWLAEKTGVSNGAVTHWVKTGQISRDSALSVAMVLGVSVDQLYGQEAPVSKPSEEMSLEWVTAEERRLLTNYRACNDMGRQMINLTANGAPRDSTTTTTATATATTKKNAA
jgi:plasmid maintenance system antidote protein VapI